MDEKREFIFEYLDSLNGLIFRPLLIGMLAYFEPNFMG